MTQSFAYYGGQCPFNVVPLSQLEPDLSGETPNFVWITPNLSHGGHACAVSAGDRWLGEAVDAHPVEDIFQNSRVWVARLFVSSGEEFVTE